MPCCGSAVSSSREATKSRNHTWFCDFAEQKLAVGALQHSTAGDGGKPSCFPRPKPTTLGGPNKQAPVASDGRACFRWRMRQRLQGIAQTISSASTPDQAGLAQEMQPVHAALPDTGAASRLNHFGTLAAAIQRARENCAQRP